MALKSRIRSGLTAGFLSLPILAAGSVTVPAATFADETPFDQASFAAAQKAGKSILVHITAPWCTTCAAQKPILERLRAEPKFKALVIYNVDFDRQKDLVRSFGATMQSTLIVFKGDVEAGRSSGTTKPDAIAALLDKAL